MGPESKRQSVDEDRGNDEDSDTDSDTDTESEDEEVCFPQKVKCYSDAIESLEEAMTFKTLYFCMCIPSTVLGVVLYITSND